MDPMRNLMVLGTNELLSRGLIELAGDSTENRDDRGYVMVDIAGKPSVVLWQNSGYEELRISVWWNYDHNKHPQANLTGNSREEFRTARPLAKKSHYPKFVGACVSGWMERKKGKHLQGFGRDHLFEIYIRRGVLDELRAIPLARPDGYNASGQFYM